MRFYTKQHPFYCGLDLHARTMDVCILSQDGELCRSQPGPTPCSRPWRPGATIGSSPSHVSFRGTGSLTWVRRQGCLWSSATPCLGKPSLGQDHKRHD